MCGVLYTRIAGPVNVERSLATGTCSRWVGQYRKNKLQIHFDTRSYLREVHRLFWEHCRPEVRVS